MARDAALGACSIHKPERRVEYYTDGNVLREEWRVAGSLHRTDGPAVQAWHRHGTLKSEEWWLDGKMHRADGPACREWRTGGTLALEEWTHDGKLHRVDGPAFRSWHPNGSMQCERWFFDGQLHRTDGPATLEWRPRQTLAAAYWAAGQPPGSSRYRGHAAEACDPATPPHVLARRARSVDPVVRTLAFHNPSTPEEARVAALLVGVLA